MYAARIEDLKQLSEELMESSETNDKKVSLGGMLIQSVQEEMNIIEEVLTSVGTCGECEHFDGTLGNFEEHGYCKLNRDSEEAIWTHIEIVKDWYCADFKRSTDGS